MKLSLTVAITMVAAFSGQASAENTYSLKAGLAQIIALAEPCKFSLDQVALDKYFKAHGLSDPTTLGSIQITVRGIRTVPPTPAECVIAKSTAQSSGLLAP